MSHLVAEVVAAYVSNNTMEVSDLPEFIRLVHRSLYGAGTRKLFSRSTHGKPVVPIEESVKLDYIVCLEDGKQIKMLKRQPTV